MFSSLVEVGESGPRGQASPNDPEPVADNLALDHVILFSWIVEHQLSSGEEAIWGK